MSRPRRKPAEFGDLVVRGDDGQTVRVELGKDRGALRISVTPTTGPINQRSRYAQLYIRWENRPEGSGQSLNPFPGILGDDYDYVTHALLDLDTGEVVPHYQSEVVNAAR